METSYKTDQINHQLDQYWRDQRTTPAPKGQKLIVFTRYGITQVGPYHQDVIAWMPIPGKPSFHPIESY